MENPFFQRGAIRSHQDFIGRTAEIEQIMGLLRNGQSVSLIGPRRIGKSSLLFRLSDPEVRREFDLDPQRAMFAHIDCQEVAGAGADEIFELFSETIKAACEAADLPLKSSGNADPATYRGVDRLISDVTRAGCKPVILLDEFELLAGNDLLTPYFFARLRGLTSKFGLAFLTASQRPLFALTASQEILSSPFFNIFVSLSLGHFTRAEGYALFERRLANSDITFGSDVIEQIFDIVGLHPFFLHVASYQVFQLLKTEGKIQWEHVNREVELSAWGHLNYLWQNLSQEERYSLAILDGPIDTMRLLEQQALIYQAQNNQFEFSNKMLERFVRRQAVEGLIQAPPFLIDHHKHTVSVNRAEVNLTAYQYNLLCRLAENRDQVVPAESLEEAVWGESLIDDPDRLKTLMKRLRKAIEPYQNWIASERGVGYILRKPENEL